MTVECLRFHSFKKGTLLGFADIYVSKWDIEVQGCTLHMKDGRRWVNLPSREYENDKGEKKFVPLFRFREKKHWERFVEEAKKAIDKFCQENQD